MGQVINFPLNKPKFPEINHDELEIPEVDFEEMYTPPVNYVSHNKCFKCGHTFKDEDYIWRLEDNPGYGSKLDGSIVSISICDDCLYDFLQKNK